MIGQPHELHGEIPIAYVSLKPGLTATPAEIRTFCGENLGRYQVPRKVIVIPDLPKNATGKIVKRELRKHGERERGVDIP